MIEDFTNSTWTQGQMDLSPTARKLRAKLKKAFAGSSLHGKCYSLSDSPEADRPAVLELIGQGYTLADILN